MGILELAGGGPLARGGVLVLVPNAKPSQLTALLRTLWSIEPSAKIVRDASELAGSEVGELIVLLLRHQDARWLNLNRPLFAQRKLRVILWGAELGPMLGAAPDFFDWVSHVVECPFGVPEFCARSLRAGSHWYPGIAWAGGLELARVLGHLDWDFVDSPGDVDYAAWVEFFSSCHASWVRIAGPSSSRVLWRIRWALAQTGYRGRVILDEPLIDTPGWFPVAARQLDLHTLDPVEVEPAVALEAEPEALDLYRLSASVPRAALMGDCDALLVEAAKASEAWPRLLRQTLRFRTGGPALRWLFATLEAQLFQLVEQHREPVGRELLAVVAGARGAERQRATLESLAADGPPSYLMPLYFELQLHELCRGQTSTWPDSGNFIAKYFDPAAAQSAAEQYGIRISQDAQLISMGPHTDNDNVVPLGELLGWDSEHLQGAALGSLHEAPAGERRRELLREIVDAAARQLGPGRDYARLLSILAAALGTWQKVEDARELLEQANVFDERARLWLSALDLLEGRVNRGQARLCDWQTTPRSQINPRERQLLVLSARMLDRATQADALVESFIDGDAPSTAAEFEFGEDPRVWLRQTLTREFLVALGSGTRAPVRAVIGDR